MKYMKFYWILFKINSMVCVSADQLYYTFNHSGLCDTDKGKVEHRAEH